MFTSILVPLDGSSSAQQALPFALSIARRANAHLELAEVHITYGGFADLDIQDTQREQQERHYLDTTAEWAASVSRVPVKASLLPGQAVPPEGVADRIIERGRIIGTDLVVMTRYRRDTLSGWACGGLSDELIRRAAIPVLLVQETEQPRPMTQEPALDRILIPLDGSSLSEQVLPAALNLARLMEGQLVLLRIINSSGCRAEAVAYLEGIVGRLREQSLQVQRRVVEARHPAAAILEEAALHRSNLIALATHGWGGLKRLLLGSVATQIIRRAPSPVLVYRPTEGGSESNLGHVPGDANASRRF
jgi:nucleotide-binding universal stress UspA family protein